MNAFGDDVGDIPHCTNNSFRDLLRHIDGLTAADRKTHKRLHLFVLVEFRLCRCFLALPRKRERDVICKHILIAPIAPIVLAQRAVCDRRIESGANVFQLESERFRDLRPCAYVGLPAPFEVGREGFAFEDLIDGARLRASRIRCDVLRAASAFARNSFKGVSDFILFHPLPDAELVQIFGHVACDLEVVKGGAIRPTHYPIAGMILVDRIQ